MSKNVKIPRGLFCLNCLNSFARENKLESHKKVCKNKDFFSLKIPSGNIKILEFNQYQKSDKATFIIYADIESVIEKIDGCKSHRNVRNKSR